MPESASPAFQPASREGRSGALSARHDLECGESLRDPTVRRLLDAYEFRQRAYRRWMIAVALVCGLVAQLVVGDPNGPSATLGVGGSPWANVILVVTAGALAGSIVAELHVFRRRNVGERTAGLEVRGLSRYARRPVRLGMWGVALTVVVVSAANLGTGRAGAVAVLPAVAAILVSLIADLVARRVASRPRPWLRPSLRHADDVIRRSAINRSLLARGLALNFLILSYAALGVVSAMSATSVAVTVAGVAATMAFIASLVVVYRSSRWILTSTLAVVA